MFINFSIYTSRYHFLTWEILGPQVEKHPRLPPPKHTCQHTRGTDQITVSHMQQAQAVLEQGGECRGRIQFWTPKGEENSKAGTLTPADGIQVPQCPAATRGLGQRPVPPWNWLGSMWRRAEGGVRREHLQGLEAKAAPSMCSHLGGIKSVSLPSPSCLRRTEFLSIGPELEWRATQ